MKIILASHNKHKVKEISDILGSNYEILSLSDLNYQEDIIENGNSFKENAYIKAKTIYDLYHYPVLSDDSGLEVDALGGKPGIYSQRYSGGDSLDNIHKLLNELQGVSNRKANFTCVLCLYMNPDNVLYFEGKCYGEIANEMSGYNGFGYDPVFLYNGKSFASMGEIEKDKVSHRYNALIKLKEYLEKDE